MSPAVPKRQNKANAFMSISKIAANHGEEACVETSSPLQPSSDKRRGVTPWDRQLSLMLLIDRCKIWNHPAYFDICRRSYDQKKEKIYETQEAKVNKSRDICESSGATLHSQSGWIAVEWHVLKNRIFWYRVILVPFSIPSSTRG